MKESQLLGTLLPSHPDLIPIAEAIRGKYNLPEISPDDEPLEEIYIGDVFVSLEEFRQEIKNRILEHLDFMPPETAKQYKTLKAFIETKEIADFEQLPNELKGTMYLMLDAMKKTMQPLFLAWDEYINGIVNMLYTFLLTGEAEEIPENWLGAVTTIPMSGEPIVFAMANQLADLEAVTQQFRREYKKNFGTYRPKITNTAVSTAYYLRLKKQKKPWKFIVEEYIERNKFQLPRDRTSKRYADVWRKHEQRLKKRMQRTEKIFDVIIGDKK